MANHKTERLIDSRAVNFYENADHEGGIYKLLTNPDEKRTWIYTEDVEHEGLRHLPANHTVFINSNIAFTDGCSTTFGDTSPRTIPNLYDALEGLALKISSLSDEISKLSTSTVDKYLYISAITDKNEYDNDVLIYTLQPGKDNDEDDSKDEATEPNTDVDRFIIKSGKGNSSISFGGNDTTITGDDIKFTIIREDGSTVSYHLGAIIEAIQELNRRTMFIDSTSTFNDSITSHDVNTKDVDNAVFESIEDGLPAASDSLYPITDRDIHEDVLAKMKILAYDPKTNTTIDVTGKKLPFSSDKSMEKATSLLKDATVITPETVEARMRGCPYLLQ
jgi:hypothetical protein